VFLRGEVPLPAGISAGPTRLFGGHRRRAEKAWLRSRFPFFLWKIQKYFIFSNEMLLIQKPPYFQVMPPPAPNGPLPNQPQSPQLPSNDPTAFQVDDWSPPYSGYGGGGGQPNLLVGEDQGIPVPAYTGVPPGSRTFEYKNMK
jgi:hypothetical protein